MEIKKIALFTLLLASTTAFAARPHFYVQMENRSEKPAAISFSQGIDNVFLVPTLTDKTPLAAASSSQKYEVHINPLTTTATFNITFTGKQDCTFNIGYYAPANPKVSVSGPGCYGGGYQVTDHGATLLLYVSDIHLNEKNR